MWLSSFYYPRDRESKRRLEGKGSNISNTLSGDGIVQHDQRPSLIYHAFLYCSDIYLMIYAAGKVSNQDYLL
jgi:hypothetical protein